jgi:hypothetical protein
MKQHKHAKEIKAWADGAEIQIYDDNLDKWRDITTPSWDKFRVYRVKPKVIWTPRYIIKTACEDGICTDAAVPKAVCNYHIIQQFVEEFDLGEDNQDSEVFKDYDESYTVYKRSDYYPSLGTVRMSEKCAKKLCDMLNNGEIEL